MNWVFYLAVLFLLLVCVSRLNDISCAKNPDHSYCHADRGTSVSVNDSANDARKNVQRLMERDLAAGLPEHGADYYLK